MKQFIYFFFYLIIGISFFSCQDDSFISENSPNDKNITITLSLPGDKHTSSTRAMSEEDEKRIDDIHVLAFLYDNTSNDYIYAYKADGTDITISNNNATFQVRLKAYDMNQRFLVIANAANEIRDINLHNLTIEDALDVLTVHSINEWLANNIPMYGITSPIILNSSTSSLNTLSMVRMLARIDIIQASTVTNFKLAEAYIFNRKDRGYIGYKEENWDSINEKILSANVPSGTITTKLPSTYFEAENNHTLRNIYTFEAKGTNNAQDATAIVIGGYFNYPANNDKITYYRIDIPEIINGIPQEGTMGDILRNHLYEISITGVSKNGENTPEEAFDGGITINTVIDAWMQRPDNKIVLDGQYKFTISQSNLVFPKQPSTIEIDYYTNHPDGLSYSILSNTSSWVAVTQTTQDNFSGTLQISTLTAATVRRSGYITIRISNLSYRILIEQQAI